MCASKISKLQWRKSNFTLLLACALWATGSGAAMAGPLDPWTVRNPGAGDVTLRGKTFGGDLFVAVGDRGTILTSQAEIALPRFRNDELARLPDGTMHLVLESQTGAEIRLQASADLSGPWNQIAVTDSAGRVEFNDATARDLTRRFYRAQAVATTGTNLSVNAVGFIFVSVPPRQFALLANQLNRPTNNLTAVLNDPPLNTKVFTFDAVSGGFSLYTKRSRSWSGSGSGIEPHLNPGTGFFIWNETASINLSFVGEVVQGNICVALTAGFNLVACPVPVGGMLSTLPGIPGRMNGDVFFVLRTTGYEICGDRPRCGAAPSVDLAESFWFYTATARTCAQSVIGD
jgi:hypothetical protein